MGVGLSIDLRKRVIAAVDQGTHIDEAVKTFTICRKTVYNWLNLRKKTNDLSPRSNYHNGHSHKITDWELFEEFVKEHKEKTIEQMLIAWKDRTNQKVSKSTMQRALKKIAFTSKKKS